MNINNKLRYFKSAVAFFFLFFLHGFSIGNGQQGISYNGIGLGEEADLTAQKMKVAQMFNTPQQLHSSTSAAFLPNPCYGQLRFNNEIL